MADSIVAQRAPFALTLRAGRSYAWCACGRSRSQPLCDGSHKVTDITPLVFKAEADKEVWLCGCKRTGDRPYCDGTHKTL